MSHSVIEFVEYLSGLWTVEVGQLRRRGLEEAARFLESLVDELKQAAQVWLDGELTLDEASELSGVAYATLQNLVRRGDLPQAGEKGRPRVRRGDLPRKGGAQRRSGVPPDENAIDLIDQALLDLER